MKSNFDELSFCKKVLDEGLAESMSLLEQELSTSCKLLDSYGYLLYPAKETDNSTLVHREDPDNRPNTDIARSMRDIPSGEYEYNPSRNSLIFAIGKRNDRGYLLVDVDNNDAVLDFMSVLPKTILGLSAYLKSYSSSKKVRHEFEDNAMRYLFASGSTNLVTLANSLGVDVDVDKVYVVSILTVEDLSDKKVPREYIRNTIIQFFRSRRQECLISFDSDRILVLLPQPNKENQFELDKNWLPNGQFRELNKIIERSYPVRVSSGISTPKTVCQLELAYREARIALSIPKILGERHYAQLYEELGGMTVIFSDCYDTYKRHSLETMNKLIHYDSIHSIHLLETLTTLVSNNFNRKVTADAMFIHINTLKYRINKIEEILSIDMCNTFDLAQLCQDSLFYFTLRENGWLEEDNTLSILQA